MDFWRAILGLIRRRYIGIPVALLAVLVAALGYLITPVSYRSTAILVFTAPTSGGTVPQDKPPGLTNPLLSFDAGLKTASAVMIQAMNAPEVLAELGAGVGSTKLIVNDGATTPALIGTSGPFIYLEGTSASAAEAQGIVLRAQQRIRDGLRDRQQALNAPPVTFITVQDVVSPSASETLHDAQVQVAGFGLAATVLVGLGGAYAAQSLLVAYVRRTRQQTPAAAVRAPSGPLVDPATERFEPVVRGGTNGKHVPQPQRVPPRAP